jgi:hypothetical protein
MQKMNSPGWFDPGEVDFHSPGKEYTKGPFNVNLEMGEHQGIVLTIPGASPGF